MHDVLDPRDTVPDEAEQLVTSGFPAAEQLERARAAAKRDDLAELAQVRTELAQLSRDGEWPHEEPDDDAALHLLLVDLPRTEPDGATLPDRLRGAWLGRTVGNTLGKPVEGLTRAQLGIYLEAAGQLPQTGYLPLLDPLPEGITALHPSAVDSAAGLFSDVPRDDDIDWTILNLHLLECHGRALTTEQIATEWLDRVPFTQTYTAERAAYRNLVRGLRPPHTATHDNPYREWIGALIRADAFGYACPGDPAEAARLALVDARLSHVANGLYGEMWAAALVASALVSSSAKQALAAARCVVPPGSRLAQALDRVVALHDGGASATDALNYVDTTLGHYPWVHTVNNAALIAVGLLWGSSFLDAVGIALTGGRDTDSNGATVGSVYGAVHGSSGIPQELVGTTHVHVRSAVRDFDRITITDLVERTLRVVQG